MDDGRFWSMIETAWDAVGGESLARGKLARGELHDTAAERLLDSMSDAVAALRLQLDGLPAHDLLSFDRTLERKLHDIDREDVQTHTDGSDDGFLYARGFIVIAGRAYYEAVAADPSIAMMDMECEEVCYLAYKLYQKKFGPVPGSDISRESHSNRAGWS